MVEEADHPTIGQRFSDNVTNFVGSWTFIILQSITLLVWIVFNLIQLVHFDPYPFILMNLFLSFQAAYTAPFIMMSQSRQAQRDRDTMMSDLKADLDSEEILQEIKDEIRDIRLKLLGETSLSSLET